MLDIQASAVEGNSTVFANMSDSSAFTNMSYMYTYIQCVCIILESAYLCRDINDIREDAVEADSSVFAVMSDFSAFTDLS